MARVIKKRRVSLYAYILFFYFTGGELNCFKKTDKYYKLDHLAI